MTTATVRIRALGYELELTADDDAVAAVAAVRSSLAALVIDDPTGAPDERVRIARASDGTWHVSGAGPESWVAPTAGRLLAGLLEHVNQRAAASVPDAVPFHAAAVCDVDGATVILAGRSGSGKSTLAAVAVRAGWGFVAEEVAVVRAPGRSVLPFHRPIGLRSEGARLTGVEPSGGPWCSEIIPWTPPAPARRSGGRAIGVALVDRTGSDPGTELVPAAALTALVEHVVVPDDDRLRSVFRGLDRLVRRLPVVTLGSRDTVGAVGRLHELCDRWRT